MNIATARRGWIAPPKLPHPHATEARDVSGRVCPVCLRWGRDRCSEHRPAACANPYCRGGLVERGDNESRGAPAMPCKACNQ